MRVMFLAVFLVASVAAENFLEQPTPPMAEKNNATVLPAVKLDAKVINTPVAAIPVPHAAVAVAVSHAQGAAPAAAPVTAHDHAAAAQKSADEAKYHLEQAQAAYAKTKANVKEIKETGKKIESTAGDIKTLYKPPAAKPTPEPVLEADLQTPPQEHQASYGGRVLSQIIFGILYYYLIVKKYPKLENMVPTDDAKNLQKMNEVSATMHTSLPNCILSWCCTGPRAAHTFHSTGTMNYWPGCFLMSCFPCCTLWYVNSFTGLNQKLGGKKRNPIMGLLSACFCSCCVVAQDAESLDLITGTDTQLCGVKQKPSP